jgi:hypothetical protein
MSFGLVWLRADDGEFVPATRFLCDACSGVIEQSVDGIAGARFDGNPPHRIFFVHIGECKTAYEQAHGVGPHNSVAMEIEKFCAGLLLYLGTIDEEMYLEVSGIRKIGREIRQQRRHRR